MPEPVLLLPPSEGKARGGRRRGRARVPRSFPSLAPARTEVSAALAAAVTDPVAAGRLLGVRGAALEAAVAADLALADAPVRPAIERYTGVLYDALDAASLPAEAADRLRREVLVVSGLWGLVRPDDPIPDYKLAMGARLPGLGRLALWWRPHLGPLLDRRARRALVWDLLPQAHAGVWAAPDRTPALRVTVAFAADERRDGRVERRAVTHWSKALKGALARHLLTAPPAAPTRTAVADVLDAFQHDRGYALAELEETGTHLHALLVAPPER